ncbi:hypothetical protein P691DRAFT_201484 [Macrolepiota fuliginosa MF-IS2]|uniref:Transcription factor CBF/NF-Y/archaeal histone domain-containing protein n=1 Tax=Macrolepiota fuliginosa MF-IS2 TaxID=1400762 RepID=A0A9P6C779_9AGAR|nr:hypothetical protein P691DRAFT_201484 [Macrolepiota fuliginosa MF-IS2]
MSAQSEFMEADEFGQDAEENELEEEEVIEEPVEGEAEAEVEAEAEAEEELGAEEDDEEEENPPGDDQPAGEAASVKKKRERREPVPLNREPGKSLLPFSRVQKIIKADKDIPLVAKDAVFVISLATEAFISELAQAAQRVAEREKRATVQHKDIGVYSLVGVLPVY